MQRDNKISWLLLHKKQIETELEEKDKALVESTKVIEEKDKALVESTKVIQEKDKALVESTKVIEEKKKALAEEKAKAKLLQLEFARMMKENGFPLRAIHEKTGVPIEELENL
jgi:hypothetical protein